jgi:hypothetical protein
MTRVADRPVVPDRIGGRQHSSPFRNQDRNRGSARSRDRTPPTEGGRHLALWWYRLALVSVSPRDETESRVRRRRPSPAAGRRFPPMVADLIACHHRRSRIWAPGCPSRRGAVAGPGRGRRGLRPRGAVGHGRNTRLSSQAALPTLQWGMKQSYTLRRTTP